jgi:hypothetical protein
MLRKFVDFTDRLGHSGMGMKLEPKNKKYRKIFVRKSLENPSF